MDISRSIGREECVQDQKHYSSIEANHKVKIRHRLSSHKRAEESVCEQDRRNRDGLEDFWFPSHPAVIQDIRWEGAQDRNELYRPHNGTRRVDKQRIVEVFPELRGHNNISNF